MSNANASNGVSGGIMLIGLGMLLLTGWWWPGIMLVLGLSAGARLFLEGQTTQALATMLLFIGIPLGIAVAQQIDIPWQWLAAFVLIAVGGSMLLRGTLAGRP